jgi:ferrous iron transport protein B
LRPCCPSPHPGHKPGSKRAEPGRPDSPVVALVGNPNTGKTALFNALTGFCRRVANYPGVTVDIGRGPVRSSRSRLEVIDLPGTYSLAAISPDELIVLNILCGAIRGVPRPKAIVAVVDASNLPRNLYLCSQVIELGLPVVIALNMVDVARNLGIRVDHARLSQRLGVQVVPVIATRPATVRPLADALEAALEFPPPASYPDLPDALRREAGSLQVSSGPLSPALGLRALLDRNGPAEQQYLAMGGSAEALAAARQRLSAAGLDDPAVEIRARYDWINRILEGVVTQPAEPVQTWSDRIDRVLTHKLAGPLVLMLVLFALFQAIFGAAAPASGIIEAAFSWLGRRAFLALPEGLLRSLLVDGVIGGVGAVLAFLPQIVILFGFIAILEDCGYLARAASMTDRLMRGLGLSGRAFIPLMCGFGCAVPAIMSTRVLGDRRERIATILLIPFMSCPARLPIYLLVISALIPDRHFVGGIVGLRGLVLMGCYLIGVVTAIPVGWLLRRTAFSGPAPGFVLELPGYRLPQIRTVWQRMWRAGRDFVVRAGTIILAVNVVVWALAYFPREAAAQSGQRQLRQSYLGRMGQALEPAIRPLGWDWRIGVAVIASLPAREVVIATLGTLFNLSDSAVGEKGGLGEAVRRARWEGTDRPLFTLPVGLSLVVFYALCAQCAGTLAMIWRETRSWRWPAISFLGMTALACGGAWLTAVAARAAGLGSF